jgi:membrane-bound lytic murein transglycosylase B
MRYVSLFALGLLAGCAGPTVVGTAPVPHTPAEESDFQSFLAQLTTDAEAQGLNTQLIRQAFGANPQPYGEAPVQQAAQPEFTNTFNIYVGKRLSPERIGKGESLYRQYAEELAAIESQTGVPAGVIVSLWGLESNFGGYQGTHPTINALATLAWQNKARRAFFTREFFAALQVAEQTGQGIDMKGSWAGAVGQSQFMPTNYLKLGKDGNGDGKVDLFGTVEDVHASIANFLQKAGWKPGSPWKHETNITQAQYDGVKDSAKINQRGLSEPFTPAQWQAMGITPPAGVPASHKIRLYQPQGPGTPILFTGPNFDVILDWNRSSYFAYTVFSLADIYQPKQVK